MPASQHKIVAGLGGEQGDVGTLCREQFLVGADLGDAAVIEDDDAVARETLARTQTAITRAGVETAQSVRDREDRPRFRRNAPTHR